MGCSSPCTAKFSTIELDYTTIQTLLGSYVSAVGEGGHNFPPGEVLHTERTSLADDALFVPDGPGVGGNSTIGTFNGHSSPHWAGAARPRTPLTPMQRLQAPGSIFGCSKAAISDLGTEMPSGPQEQGGPGEVVNFLTAVGGGGAGTVAIKSMDAQTLRLLLMARAPLVSQRQAVANNICGLAKTFGHVIAPWLQRPLPEACP